MLYFPLFLSRILTPSPFSQYITLACLLLFQSGSGCQKSERLSVCIEQPGKGAVRAESPSFGPQHEVFKLCVSPLKNQEIEEAVESGLPCYYVCQCVCMCAHFNLESIPVIKWSLNQSR